MRLFSTKFGKTNSRKLTVEFSSWLYAGMKKKDISKIKKLFTKSRKR